MTWFHLIIGGMHYIFPSTAIASLYSGATDGSQQINLQLIDGTQFVLTSAQAQKIIGAIPTPL